MKAPSYAVIKINNAGEARITKQLAAEIMALSELKSTRWRLFRRSARRAGVKYFRLRCLFKQREVWWVCKEHEALDGMAFPITAHFYCRCCDGEMMFIDSDVKKAKDEIDQRKTPKASNDQRGS